MPATIRRAIIHAPTLRAEGDEPKKIVGYGAVFYSADDPGTQYHMWSDIYERIMPGAFDEAVSGHQDVRALFNHDPNIVLGRNTSGTLKLSLDDRGLLYEITPPDTQIVREQVLGPLGRGDVSGSSIMFIPTSVTWRSEKVDGRDIDIREINKVELWEVGPVTFPAYSSTTSGLRAVTDVSPAAGEELEAERDQWKRRRQRELDAVEFRYRASRLAL